LDFRRLSLKKHSWTFGVLYGCKKYFSGHKQNMKKAKKNDEIDGVNGKKQGMKESILEVLKEPYFYLMVFLWLFSLCLAVYAVLIGAIHPY
jgi:hypothetical protein